MQNTFAFSVLHLMYVEAQAARPPSFERLCRLLGAPERAVRAELESLEAAGLANARRARLTLPGLAIAAAMRSRRDATPRVLAA